MSTNAADLWDEPNDQDRFEYETEMNVSDVMDKFDEMLIGSPPAKPAAASPGNNRHGHEVTAGEVGARPEIDYTLTAQDVALVALALEHYRKSLPANSSNPYVWPYAFSEDVCNNLREKFLRGFETVIRDIR
jgi:hypothetical protein